MGAAQAEARGGVVVPWSCQRTGARGMIDKAALGKLSAATSINRDLYALYITCCRKLHVVPSGARMSYRVKNVHAIKRR